MIRILLMLAAILGFAALTTPVDAVPLNHNQVATACGDKLNTSGGHTGCVKTCGDKVCMYDCKGKGKKEDCAGFALLTAGGGGDEPGDQPEAYLPPAPGIQFVMQHVSLGSLRSACSKIEGGIFSKTDDKYACANPNCDKSGGICMVICIGTKCHAVMPGKPGDSMSLVAILQGGSSVVHGGQLEEGGTTRSGPSPEAPKKDPVVIIY